MIMIKEVFFKNLERFITQRGHSKASFARVLGVPQSTISNWFARKNIPDDYLDQIAEALKIEVAELFIRPIEELLEESFDDDTTPPLSDEMAGELGFDLLKNEYLQPLGRVLPELPYTVLDQLKALHLNEDSDRITLIVNLLLQYFTQEKGIKTYFDEEYDGTYQDDVEELALRKKQLFQIASKIADVSQSNDLAMVEKIKRLNPTEQDLIISSIDKMIEQKKGKKSVS